MPQEMLPEMQSLPFLRYGTLPKMSAMASKLALARKAIREVVRVDSTVEAEEYIGTLSDEDKILAMKEKVKFILVAFHAVEDAVATLQEVKKNAESYRREL